MDWAVIRPRDGSPSSLVLVSEAARRLGGPRAAFASLTIHCQAMPSRGSAFSVMPVKLRVFLDFALLPSSSSSNFNKVSIRIAHVTPQFRRVDLRLSNEFCAT